MSNFELIQAARAAIEKGDYERALALLSAYLQEETFK